jgi:hypothetical protein
VTLVLESEYALCHETRLMKGSRESTAKQKNAIGRFRQWWGRNERKRSCPAVPTTSSVADTPSVSQWEGEKFEPIVGSAMGSQGSPSSARQSAVFPSSTTEFVDYDVMKNLVNLRVGSQIGGMEEGVVLND